MKLFLFGKTFKYTLLLIILFELLSYLGWYWPILNTIIFWFVIASTFVIAWRRLDIALGVVLVELFIGSKGYLFIWNWGNFTISLRLGLFITIFIIWIIKYLIKGKIDFRHSNIFKYYILLLVALGWGLVSALLHHNNLKDIFFDGNAFLYFGLIFIVYDVIKDYKKIGYLLDLLFASFVAIGLKTVLLLFMFAGQFSFLPELYRWVRDTRVNEITLIAYNFYRIFSQTQIWSLFGLIILLTILIFKSQNTTRENYKKFGAIFIFCSLTVLISYSRSFWLSIIITLLVILFIFIKKYRYSLKKIFKIIIILGIILVSQIGFIYLLINTPNWLRSGGQTASLSSLVEERLGDTEEASLQSRWNLLKPLSTKIFNNPILGYGFGTNITYQSSDPRNLQENEGLRTTYMFEWGYLDLILKIGIIGLFIYILFIWKIAQNGLAAFKKINNDGYILTISLLFGLLSLIITHLTTPYLNHPLGIGYLIITAVIFERLRNVPFPE